MDTKLTVADFFCGAWGFSEWFRQKWFDVIFALDNWKPAVETHDLNHPAHKTTLMNILELDTVEKIDAVIPDTEIIVWSPPCVSFSYSNKAGKADKSLWIQLIMQYLKIVLWKMHKPNSKLKYWIMENVPNSKNFVKPKYTWQELWLPWKWPDLEITTNEVLLASDYWAPQNRLRFVCWNYPVPKKTHKWKEVLVKDVMKHLHNPLLSNKVSDIEDPIYGFSLQKSKLTDHFYDTRIPESDWKKAQRLKEDHGFMGKMSFPEWLDRTSRTVTATQSASTRESIIFGAEKNKDWNRDCYRLPTIREISCFMGFPIDYQFGWSNESTKYKLVWNAVCPPMSAALAWAILEKLWKKNPNFINWKRNTAPVDLTWRKIKLKSQSTKKITAKYSRHIPYLKVSSLRVELTNKDSNFEKEKFKWTTSLHRGSWKGAKSYDVENSLLSGISKALSHESKFQKLMDYIEKQVDCRVTSHNEMQKKLCWVSTSKHLWPDELLETIKNWIDKFFWKEYDNIIVEKEKIVWKKNINLPPRSDFPIKIILWIYCLQYAASKMK